MKNPLLKRLIFFVFIFAQVQTFAQWSNVGTTHITNTNSGNVGIGTAATNPAYKLDVVGTVRSKANLLTTGVGTNNGYFADDGVGATIFSISRQASNEMRIQSYGFHTFYSGGNTGTEKMRIDANGRVGIGITSPVKALEVNTSVNNFVSVGANIQGNEFSGIHFGYIEPGSANYRKSALVFERVDNSARGKIHILNNGTWSNVSASLSDARMTINHDGSVGIGVTNPVKALEVNTSANNFISVGTNIQGSEFSGIHFGYLEAGNTLYRKSALVFERVDNAARGKIHFLNNGTWSNASATLSDSKMTINYDGNVGIGTSEPEHLLDVNGTFRSKTNLRTRGVGSGNGYFADDGVGATIFSFTRQENNEVRFQSYGYHTFYSGGNTGTEKMRIAANGNVGIGTNNPDQKLTVNGIIHTKEVRVDVQSPLDVGDYVFEEEYKLMPLSEIETYVKANKHLPEVPSANQFVEEGMNLKEMNLLLLKKVEELTLHMIALEKKNEFLEAEVKKLQPK